jgi:DNA-binding winged helix-turn-helix (wHTH) protein/Tol biopolymer transport system component
MGEMEVLPSSNEIRTRKGLVRLRPLLMEILLRLAQEPGIVVPRETLLADVWERRMVNDEVLSRAIAELRTVLGDDAKASRYIETIPKTGYRLVAPIEMLAAEPVLPPPHRGKLIAFAFAFVFIVSMALGWWLRPRNEPPSPLAGIEQRLAAAQPFSSDPALELAPRFSPDGRSIAFVLSKGRVSRIVIQAIDGSDRQVIGDDTYGLHSPVFFPDGKRLAMWKQAQGQKCAIVERELATGAERVLVDCALEPHPRFDLSKDGRFVAFTGNTRPQFPAGIWVADVHGNAPVVLTTPEPGMGDDQFPRFSPDGKRIAFFRGGESHRQPWIVARDEVKSARPVAGVEGLSYGFAWAGDDGPMLAAADWFGYRAINVLDPRLGTAKIAGARGARFPDVSSNGDIVYESATYSANLWILDPTNPAARKSMWLSTRYSNQPDVSPDGARVAFSSNREGLDAIYVGALGGDVRRIAASPKYRYFAPHWSSDGKHVYAVRGDVNATAKTVQHGVRIAAEGGAEEVLESLGDAVNRVFESRDGRWLYFAELAGSAMRLLRAPNGRSGDIERLPMPLVSQYFLNATHLVFAQPHLTRLTSCALQDLACKVLPVHVADDDLFHWAIGPRSLFTRVRSDGGARIARYDVRTGALLGSIDFFPTGAGTSLAVFPDESRLMVVREEGPAIDLMLARRARQN